MPLLSILRRAHLFLSSTVSLYTLFAGTCFFLFLGLLYPQSPYIAVSCIVCGFFGLGLYSACTAKRKRIAFLYIGWNISIFLLAFVGDWWPNIGLNLFCFFGFFFMPDDDDWPPRKSNKVSKGQLRWVPEGIPI